MEKNVNLETNIIDQIKEERTLIKARQDEQTNKMQSEHEKKGEQSG